MKLSSSPRSRFEGIGTKLRTAGGHMISLSSSPRPRFGGEGSGVRGLQAGEVLHSEPAMCPARAAPLPAHLSVAALPRLPTPEAGRGGEKFLRPDRPDRLASSATEGPNSGEFSYDRNAIASRLYTLPAA